MATFQLISPYSATGDQPQAIRQLSEGLRQGQRSQVLVGVTGSGKTFTMANVIASQDRPVLILSHNKTLAAQLYSEMRAFFPHNAVEYYVSYYDYYQPEAYIPSSDTYIEKDLAINDEIDKLRLRATSALLSGRRDVIVVSSVSCIYGMGNPAAFYQSMIELHVGQELDRNDLLRRLLDSLYVRNDVTLSRGEVRVKGDTVDVAIAYSDYILRVTFWGNEIESLEEMDPETMTRTASFDRYCIYPANLFITSREQQELAVRRIEDDLALQEAHFIEIGKDVEAKRIHERVLYDVEMIRELGHCSGIENYSRYFDGREAGTRPFCLLDFFPAGDFLLFIDESHVTVPQVRGMYSGDRARKQNLVNYGFRLPAALDNRPLRFDEFQALVPQVVYVSATPADFELAQCGGVVVEQLVRPTGLLDPVIDVRPRQHEVDDLINEIRDRIEVGERTLVVTLSKRNAEEMSEHLIHLGIKACYIHSEVDTLDRVRIMEDLRQGVYDVLVGVNLLREGLDLPQVSLVAILDADNEGFLRSRVSLTQTIGRAARHVHGRAILYASRITDSMRACIEETAHRREVQLSYNAEHHITPHPVSQSASSLGALSALSPSMAAEARAAAHAPAAPVLDPVTLSMDAEQLRKLIKATQRQMQQAAKSLDFSSAAHFRDEMLQLEELLRTKEAQS